MIGGLVLPVSGVAYGSSSIQPAVEPSFSGLVPARLLDSRAGGSTVDGQFAGIGLRPPGSVLTLPVAGRGGVPTEAAAVVLNVTVTQPVAPGYVTVFPCDEAMPTASNLNYSTGQTVPNAVIAKVSVTGTVCLYTLTATDLIVDVNGSFAGGPPVTQPNQQPQTLTAGGDHTCALLDSGGVVCWGLNSKGQLGNYSNSDPLAPVTVNGLSRVVALSAGGEHTCALQADGTVRCWGSNDFGQLGNGTSVPYSVAPVKVSGLSTVVALSAGTNHTCALLDGGGAKCWGANGWGQLGNGTVTTSTPLPVTVSGLAGAVTISAGGGHTCARFADGTGECWGLNSAGRLGDGTTTNAPVPVPVLGLSGATRLVAGNTETCAVMGDVSARCWGLNNAGQLGNGSTGSSPSPVPVSGLGGVADLAIGGLHVCARLTGGEVRCWGDDQFGQLGNGAQGASPVPVAVSGGTAIVGLFAGSLHTCALLGNGTAQCWGYGLFGQLGDDATANATAPVPVTAVTGIRVPA